MQKEMLSIDIIEIIENIGKSNIISLPCFLYCQANISQKYILNFYFSIVVDMRI